MAASHAYPYDRRYSKRKQLRSRHRARLRRMVEEPLRDIVKTLARASTDHEPCRDRSSTTVRTIDCRAEHHVPEDQGSQRHDVPKREAQPCASPEPESCPVAERPSNRSTVNPTLRGLTIALKRPDSASGYLDAPERNRRNCEGRRKSKPRRGVKDGAKRTQSGPGGRTSRCSSHRVCHQLPCPSTAVLVPKHVGTGDPVDRVWSSRQSLLRERNHHCGEQETSGQPTSPVDASDHAEHGASERWSKNKRESCIH